MKSSISGFHKLSMNKRLSLIKKFASLTDQEVDLLKQGSALDLKTADMLIENVLGTTQMPVGVATNFLINGKNYMVPMAIEETSVIAAASYAAKLARPEGGFTATSDPPVMIGQIQILSSGRKLKKAAKIIHNNKEKIIALARKQDSIVNKIGGGLRDVETRIIKTMLGKMLIVHLMVDVRDAMGANLVNTLVERLSPFLEEITGCKTRLRIVTNLAAKRIAKARAIWNKDVIGEDIVNGILEAYAFAASDQYRCATHNKGIMNGIDAVAIATGNDFRALEAGAHAYASISGKYSPLTRYEKDKEGNLIGYIEMPIAVGIVGGATRVNPIAKISLKILKVKRAQELAEVMAAVGLAQNFAALRALAKEGIQRGHMKLHANNIAIMAGAKGKEIENISEEMIEEKNISISRARQLLHKLLHRHHEKKRKQQESKKAK